MNIEDVFRRREVVSLAELADLLSADPSAIQSQLDRCVREGKIERIEPVAWTPGAPEVAVFYRWKRPSDSYYLWQKELCVVCR